MKSSRITFEKLHSHGTPQSIHRISMRVQQVTSTDNLCNRAREVHQVLSEQPGARFPTVVVTNYTITLQQPIVRRLIFLFTSSLPSKLSASLPATATTKTPIQSVSYDCGVRNSSPPTPHSNTPWERWVVHNNKLPPGWERTETEYTPLLGRLDSTPVLVP